MSINEIIKKEYKSMRKDICNKLLKKHQDDLNKEEYPEKNHKDILTCIICGSNYTRSVKTSHCATKKHKRALNSIYETLHIPS